MNLLKRYAVWLRRMPHSRGFGVQSPSAYRFIRYVISEHYPYYAYAALRRRYRRLGWLTLKRMELYFRVANYRQARLFADNGADTAVLADYVRHGCRRTVVAAADALMAAADSGACRVEAARVCPVEGCGEWLDWLLAHTDSQSVIIVEDIACNATARSLWQRLAASTAVSVSYDLYWAGIAFFDTKRNKANYIVNF